MTSTHNNLQSAEKANQYLATIDTGIRKMVRAKGGGDTEGMAMASLSQQLGESMELLTTETTKFDRVS